jgi:hypothetical protein
MFGKRRREDFEMSSKTAIPVGGVIREGPASARPSSTRPGETTLEFFREGEQHEAAGWTDTALPPDDEPTKDPKIKFKSFDKIAKRRSLTVAFLVMAVGLVAAVAIGIVAARRTERSLSSSLGSLFGFGGRAPEAKRGSGEFPAALPPPILIPDADWASTRPQRTDTSMGTEIYP